MQTLLNHPPLLRASPPVPATLQRELVLQCLHGVRASKYVPPLHRASPQPPPLPHNRLTAAKQLGKLEAARQKSLSDMRCPSSSFSRPALSCMLLHLFWTTSFRVKAVSNEISSVGCECAGFWPPVVWASPRLPATASYRAPCFAVQACAEKQGLDSTSGVSKKNCLFFSPGCRRLLCILFLPHMQNTDFSQLRTAGRPACNLAS